MMGMFQILFFVQEGWHCGVNYSNSFVVLTEITSLFGRNLSKAQMRQGASPLEIS